MIKSFLTLVFSALFLNFGVSPASGIPNPGKEMTTYFFIRHAEKDTSDPKDRNPKLSPAGQIRAKHWAEIFRETSFDLIYSTNYHRTLETAQVIAKSQDLKVKIYNPVQMNDEDFQKLTKGKTVLVVGHSNTNPHFINSILQVARYTDIDEAESGSLFIVSVSPSGETTSQVLYIN